MTTAGMRHWVLPHTHNIRDLGGYPRSSGGMTQWGRVLRAEALHELNEDSVSALIENGLSLVIDLRGPHETHLPHPFRDNPAVGYRNIVLFDALAPIAMSTGQFVMADRYCDALDNCGPRLAEVMEAIIDAPPGIVLFHCTAGKDRTGIVAALLLSAAGVDRNDVAADYALTASAEGLIDALRERAIKAGGTREHVDRVLASETETMLAMLDHLDNAHGGINAYLSAIGITPSKASRLIDRLCA